jgi:hypothetical protein
MFEHFMSDRVDEEIDSGHEMKCEFTESRRGTVAGFESGDDGCDVLMVCQPDAHLNLFMEE